MQNVTPTSQYVLNLPFLFFQGQDGSSVNWVSKSDFDVSAGLVRDSVMGELEAAPGSVKTQVRTAHIGVYEPICLREVR